MMNTQECKDKLVWMNTVIRKIDEEIKQYWVRQGQQVHIQSDGLFVVSRILMQGEIEQNLTTKKIWALFCLVHTECGTIYSSPVPVMSEGTVDLRQLVNPEVVTVTYRKTVKTTRFYDAVMIRDGYQFTIKVKDNKYAKYTS